MAKRIARPELTFKQQNDLRRVVRSAQSVEEFQRSRAICLLARGWEVAKIAEALGTTASAVYRWRKRWEEGGAAALRDRPRSGRPRVYSKATRNRLCRLVERGPRRLGLALTVWSVLTLAAYVCFRTQTRISPSHLRRILHEEGYVWRRPKLTLRHRQNRKLYRMSRKRLRSLEKRARREGSDMVLLYVDEAEFHLNPGLVGMWTRRGCQPEVPSAGQNRKVAVFGGINATTGRMVWHLCARKNQLEFEQFLTTVLQGIRGKRIVVVLDNVAYHKTKAIRAFAEKHQARLEFVWLPPYSPSLNRIERVWKHIKSHYVYNEFFGDVLGLTRAVGNALEELNTNLRLARGLLASKRARNRAA